MPTFPLLFIQIQLAVGVSQSQIISKPLLQALQSPNPSSSTPGLGERCEGVCSSTAQAVCKNSTCVCSPSFPVPIKEKGTCYKATLLGEDCEDDLQCQFYDQNSICRRLSTEYMECVCTSEYVMKDIVGLKPPKVCFPGPAMTHQDIQTFLGMGVGLSIVSFLICFALRMFAKARFARPRRYANAAIPPPLTVSELQPMIAVERKSEDGSSTLSEDISPSSRPEGDINYITLLPIGIIPDGVLHGLSSKRGNRIPRERFSSLPEDIQETYAAFALAAAENAHNNQSSLRSHGARSNGSSRRTSYASLQHQRAGNLLRLSSASSLSHQRPGSRRPSVNSIRSYRSQTGLVLPDSRLDRDHYILYMIRGPAHSLTSETTTTTTCDSTSPRTPKSSEQILAVYQAVPEHQFLDLGVVGPSHTTSTFKTMSSEDIFQEEEEEEMETEEEDEDDEENRELKYQSSAHSDSKSNTSAQYDSKSQTSFQYDSKSQTSEQFDSKSQTSTQDDSKSHTSTKDDSKSLSGLVDETSGQSSSKNEPTSLVPPRTDAKRRSGGAQGRVAVHYELRRLPSSHSETQGLLFANVDTKIRRSPQRESKSLLPSETKGRRSPQFESKSLLPSESKSRLSESKSQMLAQGKSKLKSTFGPAEEKMGDDLGNKL